MLVLRNSAGKPFLALFTDLDGVRSVAQLHNCGILEMDALQALQGALRSAHEGVIINPGAEQVVLDRRHLGLLYREYATIALEGMGGGWVPTRDDSLLLVEVLPGVCTLPVYLTEQDAQQCASDYGGQVILQSWSRIRNRAQEAGTDGALLQYGLPDQVPLLRRHLTHLAGTTAADPLETLEEAVAASMGIANALEIWRALAALQHVWVLGDADGDIVSFGRTFNLFTSGALAHAFIAQARQKNPGLPEVVPMLMGAQPLFRALVPQSPPIAINRGSELSWVGAEDTIPQIIRLASGAEAMVQVSGQPSDGGAPKKSWWARITGR